MRRRTALKLAAALTTTLGSLPVRSSSKRRVLVVGAGIVGASIAYHLAQLGCKVTVIDKQGPASHASLATFAWINATWAKQPQAYHLLNQQSVSSWGKLAESLEIPVRWGGSLEWFASPQRQIKLAGQIAEQVAWGEPAKMLDRPEFTELEPHVEFGNTERVAWSPNDGAVDPVVATKLLLSAAVQLGAELRYPCELTGVTRSGAKIISAQTSRGDIRTSCVVLATGAATEISEDVTGFAIVQRTTAGIIAISKPMPRLLRGIVAVPGAHLHQRGDGRFVIGEQSGPPARPAHQQRLATRPKSFPDQAIAKQHWARMINLAKPFLPAVAEAKLEEIHIGWRPLPLDGQPVLGFAAESQDVYMAITHSGVTLAPLIGQLAAQEIVNNLQLDQLSEYRPNREFVQVKRY
jgi:glycine/D-amino acid oxidase-like deaminating enzyme